MYAAGIRILKGPMRNMMALMCAILSVVFIFSTTPSSAMEWEDAIKKVEQSQKEYHDFAVGLGAGFLGNGYDGYMFIQHKCAIVGRMLGQVEAIKEIEEFDYPAMTQDADPDELLVFSESLNNWVAAARWALDQGQAKRANFWNLECIGHSGITNGRLVDSDSPIAEFVMSYNTVLVYGDIDRGFFDRFEVFLTDAMMTNPNLVSVQLGSGGGSLIDAMSSGRLIRAKGLSTTIIGKCYSACPFIFMGGVERTMGSGYTSLGLHQLYTQAGPVPFTDPIYTTVAEYVAEMGVDAPTIIQWVQSAKPEKMYMPGGEILCGSNLTTWVHRTCGF